LDTILDVQTPAVLTEEQQQMVDSAAELLYGLIHARFVLTNKGLDCMAEKYEEVDFGRCHRVLCDGQPVVPMGQADAPRKYTVSVFCPRCSDVYFPKSSRHGNVDGAFFGTTFPHLFFLIFKEFRPPPPKSLYTPRIYGFRVYRGQLEDDAAAAEVSAADEGRPHNFQVRLAPPPVPGGPPAPADTTFPLPGSVPVQRTPASADTPAASAQQADAVNEAKKEAWQAGYEAAKAQVAAQIAAVSPGGVSSIKAGDSGGEVMGGAAPSEQTSVTANSDK
jgi:casein kinase II subunit beta